MENIGVSDHEEIESKIISAMKIACEDTFYFSEDETHLIDAEYLLLNDEKGKTVECIGRGPGAKWQNKG